MNSKHESSSSEPRRGFFVRFSAIVAGAVAVLTPAAAALAVLLDPLRRSSSGDRFVDVVPLDALPDDGLPYQFPVVDDRKDAWNRFPLQPIGAVYLSRSPGAEIVTAFNVECPHAGCFVSFVAARKEYQCPCHTSAFALDGQTLGGPSPRGLDTLETRIRDAEGGGKIVQVQFQSFYTGRAEKKAKS